MRVLQFVRAQKWSILLILVACFLFYWYEVRPIHTYRSCVQQASVDARKLLDSKLQLSRDARQIQFYKGLKEKSMYLRTDYESFLNKCLLYYGLQTMKLSESEGSSSSI